MTMLWSLMGSALTPARRRSLGGRYATGRDHRRWPPGSLVGTETLENIGRTEGCGRVDERPDAVRRLSADDRA